MKALLLLSCAALIGMVSANILTEAKTTATNLEQRYAKQYVAYSEPTGFSTEPSNPTPTSSSSTSTSTASASPTGDVSSNWAGYVSTGGTYTAISGSWIVPSVSATDDTIAADASWIGIGGVSSEDLIQVGIQNQVEDGQVTSATFYEQLPNTSQTISTITVNPGDSVSASIDETSTNEWSISIKDNTNGESYNNVVYYDSSESSAEWIEEAPSSETSVLPLDNFNSVSFSAGQITDNGNVTSISGSNAQVINMDNESGQALTSTSAVTNGGDFTVTRTAASAEGATTSNLGFGSYHHGWSRSEPGLRARIGRISYLGGGE